MAGFSSSGDSCFLLVISRGPSVVRGALTGLSQLHSGGCQVFYRLVRHTFRELLLYVPCGPPTASTHQLRKILVSLLDFFFLSSALTALFIVIITFYMRHPNSCAL